MRVQQTGHFNTLIILNNFFVTGDLGSRAMRRRLPFTSSPNYLPLKGKKVYLDLKNFRGVKPVEEDLLALGAVSHQAYDVYWHS